VGDSTVIKISNLQRPKKGCESDKKKGVPLADQQRLRRAKEGTIESRKGKTSLGPFGAWGVVDFRTGENRERNRPQSPAKRGNKKRLPQMCGKLLRRR